MKNKTNKLRNAFLVVSLCLLNTISYGQTKEETISWLKEKLSSYLIYNYPLPDASIKLESIDECTFIIYFTGTDYGEKYFLRSIFPTDGLSFNDEGKAFYNNKVIASQCSTYSGTEYDKSSYHFQLEDREDKIRERVKKALDHLATFCSKKKETF